MDAFKVETHPGKGGWKCPCCAPAPKDRPKWRRAARARLAAKTRKEVMMEQTRFVKGDMVRLRKGYEFFSTFGKLMRVLEVAPSNPETDDGWVYRTDLPCEEHGAWYNDYELEKV